MVGFVASVISILTFVTGFNSLRQLLPGMVQRSASSHSDVPSSDTTVSPLVTNALTTLEIGQNVDYPLQILGPPVVTRHHARQQAFGATTVDLELLYYRFSFRESCDIQLLATPDRVVTAFIIHGCGYSFTGDTWKVGKSTFSELGDLTHSATQLVGGDAKFPAYVEKRYFGRHGHYHDFYFAGQWPGLPLDDSSLSDVDRKSDIIKAVAVVQMPTAIDASQAKNWDAFIAEIAGVHVTRFEGL
jgi:hypothetical protein